MNAIVDRPRHDLPLLRALTDAELLDLAAGECIALAGHLREYHSRFTHLPAGALSTTPEDARRLADLGQALLERGAVRR
jgi:hypothetical protein